MVPELSTSPCLPHVGMFLWPLLNATPSFTVHSSVFLHYTFICPARNWETEPFFAKEWDLCSSLSPPQSKRAPVGFCSWNFSKLEVLKTSSGKRYPFLPENSQRASSIRLLSEPKHICFHRRIVGCLLTAECLFWDHLAAWNNVLVETVEMSVLRVFNSYLLRIPNGTNILNKEQNYPDQKRSAVTSRRCWKIWQGVERSMKFP